MAEHPIIAPKKLIEVALPLDEINKACRREKSIRHGHPSTLHLWWARRPLAAARAVLFAQLVNDPSWKYSDEELKKAQIKSAITKKRNELFRLITELVQWENTTNEGVLSRARAEIRASWRETCEANKDHPEAATLFDPEKLPAFHDPFAGGGAIPLEAQRLGLEAHATDLNPVAVLINKAMIEIPPKFAGRPPVGPLPPDEKQTRASPPGMWSASRGLGEDVRRYGRWLRDKAWEKIKHLYPTVVVGRAPKHRPDLKPYEGQELLPIAWIWARTVRSPNPAFADVDVPLITSFWLSKKPGKETWLKPIRTGKGYTFEVRTGVPEKAEAIDLGTKGGPRAGFKCLMSGSPITNDYIREQGERHGLGHRLLAVVADGSGRRVYLDADAAKESVGGPLKAVWRPRGDVPSRLTGGTCYAYGLHTWGDLYSERQLCSLSTFSSLLDALTEQVALDALGQWGAGTEVLAREYANAIRVYQSFAIDKAAEALTTICTWSSAPKNELVVSTFRRQALPMTWDWAEANPFADSSGSFAKISAAVSRVVADLPASESSKAFQSDAQSSGWNAAPSVISTDPPYYDNISYADLSDFFYVWLQHNLRRAYPDLTAGMLVPKEEELVATAYRHGGRQEAERFFLNGMGQALERIHAASYPGFPVTLYYAFKQSDDDADTGESSSSGWETFLQAILSSGLSIVGTWPMRTERGGRSVGIRTNALASSIVLVCRTRPAASISIARKDFLRELDRTLPVSIAEMTADPTASIAPVDLAQACIGPGMAIFSKHRGVLEADGSPMTVHRALVHINKAIDDYFAQAEGDLDADTRFCIGWFQQYGFESGAFGEADVLARAKGTSVDGVREAGVLDSAKGKVRLLRIKEYPADWDPTTDSRTPIWEACHHMCRALGQSEHEAGELLARMPEKQDGIRQLAYRLYTLCERQGRAEEARAYNELITSWPAIVEESQKVGLVWTQPSLLGSEPTPPPKKKSRRK